jgi:hypothetical protein
MIDRIFNQGFCECKNIEKMDLPGFEPEASASLEKTSGTPLLYMQGQRSGQTELQAQI